MARIRHIDLAALAATVYGEALHEPRTGQDAVAWSAINRSRIAGVPIADVVYGSVSPKYGQYSFANPSKANLQKTRYAKGIERAAKENTAGWQKAVQVAKDALYGISTDPTNGATHYYNPREASPPWARDIPFTMTIGNHRFHTETDAGTKAIVRPAAESKHKFDYLDTMQGVAGYFGLPVPSSRADALAGIGINATDPAALSTPERLGIAGKAPISNTTPEPSFPGIDTGFEYGLLGDTMEMVGLGGLDGRLGHQSYEGFSRYGMPGIESGFSPAVGTVEGYQQYARSRGVDFDGQPTPAARLNISAHPHRVLTIRLVRPIQSRGPALSRRLLNTRHLRRSLRLVRAMQRWQRPIRALQIVWHGLASVGWMDDSWQRNLRKMKDLAVVLSRQGCHLCFTHTIRARSIAFRFRRPSPADIGRCRHRCHGAVRSRLVASCRFQRRAPKGGCGRHHRAYRFPGRHRGVAQVWLRCTMQSRHWAHTRPDRSNRSSISCWISC